LKEKFENFSPEVPTFMWDAVEEKLEARRSKRIGVVWSSVATVVLIAVSGALFFSSPDTVPMKNQEISSIKENSSSEENNRLQNNSDNQKSLELIENSAAANSANFQSNSEMISSQKGNARISKSNNGIGVHNSVGTSKQKLVSKSDGQLGSNLNPIQGTGVQSNLVANPTNKTNFNSVADATGWNEMNPGYSEFLQAPYSGAPLKEMIVGDFLQLTLSIPPPQKPLKRMLSRWAFEVGYDMNQTAMSYSVNPQLGQYVHKNYLQRMKEGEVALAAPQLHTSLRYQVNKNWIVTAGFGFTQNRTSQSFDFRDSVPVSVAQGFEADAYGNYPIFGYVGLGQNVKYDGIQTFSMISIPVGVVYEYPISRRLKFTTEANLRYNYVSGTSGATLNYYDLSLQNSSKDLYRNSVFSAKLGAGIQKDIDKKRSIGIRVNTQGAITPMNLENSAVSNRGWSVGLSGYYFWRIF